MVIGSCVERRWFSDNEQFQGSGCRIKAKFHLHRWFDGYVKINGANSRKLWGVNMEAVVFFPQGISKSGYCSWLLRKCFNYGWRKIKSNLTKIFKLYCEILKIRTSSFICFVKQYPVHLSSVIFYLFIYKNCLFFRTFVCEWMHHK